MDYCLHNTEFNMPNNYPVGYTCGIFELFSLPYILLKMIVIYNTVFAILATGILPVTVNVISGMLEEYPLRHIAARSAGTHFSGYTNNQ